jgi:hypothetical protein
VRAALATLPWAEQDKIQMDFKSRELKFGCTDPKLFDAEAVKQALKAQNFPNVEHLSGPS